MSIDFEKIRRLVTLVEKNRLLELTVEEEGLSVTIKCEACGEKTSVQGAVVQAVPQASAAEQHPVPHEVYVEEVSAEEEPAGEHLYEITSPMIGVFYRCPSPDSQPFVEVGDHVEVGQSVGLIEAMKVFSEVPSEVSGRVVSIPAANRGLVQQGDVLLVIDTSDTGD